MAIISKSVLVLVLSTIAALTSASPAPQAASSSTSSASSSSPTAVTLTALLPGSRADKQVFTAAFKNFMVFNHTTLPSTDCPIAGSSHANSSVDPLDPHASSSSSTSAAAARPSVQPRDNPSGSSSSGSASCPPPSNTTVFTVSPLTTPNLASFPISVLALSVVVPGGQNVYIGSDDAFSYTAPHAGGVPQTGNDGETTVPFLIGSDGKVQVEGRQWCLNPTSMDGLWQVYLPKIGSGKQGCQNFEVQSNAWTGGVGAWEYTALA